MSGSGPGPAEAAPTWAAYRARCDAPDAWSRWMLQRTAALLAARGATALALRLEQTCDGVPLPKPEGHMGPPATDMFVLALPQAALDAIVACVAAAAAEGWRVSALDEPPAAWRAVADDTSRGRDLGGFVAAWREYRDTVAGGRV